MNKNKQEAEEIIKNSNGLTPKPYSFNEGRAKGFLEGLEQGVKIGYEQGRSTNGEKSYEDGIREAAEKCKVRLVDDDIQVNLIKKVMNEILSLLDPQVFSERTLTITKGTEISSLLENEKQ